MNEEQDIEVAALGNGCLAGCGSGCFSLLIIMGLMAMSGSDLSHLTAESVPGWVKFIGFLMGLATHMIIGYVAARSASQRPIFHAIILGILAMLFGLFGIVSEEKSTVDASARLGGIISWLLTIPMVLTGANIAIRQQERDNENRLN